MKIIDFKQGTNEWKEWRLKGIGGSDAPAIDGSCPYKTVRSLFLEKKKLPLVKDEDDSKEFIFNKGNEIEKIIRHAFQEKMQDSFSPICLEHDKYNYLKASLDGLNESKGILEAKLVGKKVIDIATAEKTIPKHHYTQIQHQLLVSGAEIAYWFGHDGKSSGAVVLIKANVEFIKILEEKEHKFWDDVLNEKIPPLSDRDYLIPEDQTLLLELKEAVAKEKELKKTSEELKAHAINSYGHTRIAGEGVKIYKSTRNGSIDYLEIPEIKNIIKDLSPDYLESFRKKSSDVWTVSLR